MQSSKALVTAYMEDVWVNRKVDALETYISKESFVQHNPHLEDGLDSLKAFLPHLFSNMMPEGTWELKRVIAEGNMVVTHSLAKPTPDALGMAVVDIFGWKTARL